MNNVIRKAFRISEIFNVKIGKALNRDSVIFVSSSKKGAEKYITRKETNNGVEGYILNDVNFLNENTDFSITIGNEVAKAFVQTGNYFTGTKVNILEPKFSANFEVMLYISAIINHGCKKIFSWSYTINSTRLRALYIELPITRTGDLNIEYMADYIRRFSNKLPTEKDFIEPSIKKSKVTKYDLENWMEHKITDFFTLHAGKYYSKDVYASGKVPLVSTSDSNNGILNYIDVVPLYSNCITIGKVGCTVFYHDYEFVASSDVTVLAPITFLNKHIMLFIVSVLKLENMKWNYGRQIRLGDCADLVIKLPTLENGKLDLEYMESYIESLPYTSLI